MIFFFQARAQSNRNLFTLCYIFKKILIRRILFRWLQAWRYPETYILYSTVHFPQHDCSHAYPRKNIRVVHGQHVAHRMDNVYASGAVRLSVALHNFKLIGTDIISKRPRNGDSVAHFSYTIRQHKGRRMLASPWCSQNHRDIFRRCDARYIVQSFQESLIPKIGSIH